MPRGYIYPPDREFGPWKYSSRLFWSKVEQLGPDECWRWLGAQGPAGPLFGVHKQDSQGHWGGQMTQARRVLYAETNGHWLNQEQRQGIYHQCRNKNCMNPSHLTTAKHQHYRPRTK